MYKAPQAALFKGGNASADTLISRSSARPTSLTSFKTARDDMVKGRSQREMEQGRIRRCEMSAV